MLRNWGRAPCADFFDFLRDFFTGLPSSDYNADGLINSQDYFDFLVAFFSPCV